MKDRRQTEFETGAAQQRARATLDAREDGRAGVRVKAAVRDQREFLTRTLDESLPKEHRARDIWEITGRLDLSEMYARIGARASNPGAPAIDPRITLCLWIFATCEGEGSSHEIARLCELHDAYRWLCGGVSVRQRHLSNFRANSGELFADLITQVVSVLLKAGLCSLERIAQDGTRIRASAGAASFRREETLIELRKEARAHLDAVLQDAQRGEHTAVRRAARERGARERLERIDAAFAEMPDAAAAKKRNRDDTPPRVSTTDPDARVMKRGDGGFRPCFNAQFATTADDARVIVAVDVTNKGSDQGEAEPMLDQIDAMYGQRPNELLVDGGYLAHDTLDTLAPSTTVYAPLPKPRKDQRPPTEPRASDSPSVAEWRERMQTDEAKLLYRARAATAETSNADGKAHRGLDHVPIRGLPKAFAFVALVALSYDIVRIISLSRGV
jgi:transposase